MKICGKFSLPVCDKYTNVILIKNLLHFLNAKCNSIFIYDLCLKQISCLKTCHTYSAAVKGDCDNLLLIRKGDFETIYVANNSFFEIDKIILKVPLKYKSEILSIAYDECMKKIYLATKKTIYSVTIDGDFIKDELSNETVNTISNKKNIIVNYKNICGRKLPIKNIVWQPHITSVGFFCNFLYVGYIKNGSCYISIISSNGNIVDNFYIGDDIEINTIFSIFDTLSFLITKKESYNYIFISCDKKCCNKECCPVCPKPEPHDWCIEKCNIIDSIALMEASLSHIINAEGEKIQKAVQCSSNINDLIKVNESVNETINNVTMLEFLLSKKLKNSLDNKN